MKKTLTLILLFSISTLFAQSNNDKARAYFNQAQSAFSSSNYAQTIEYLDSAEQLLGTTNPVILNLKVKSYYNLKQYDDAKKSLSQFSKVSSKADSGLVDETLAYIVKIDDALAEEKASIERTRLAEIQRKEDARLADIKRKEEDRRAEIKINEKNERKKNLERLKRKEYYNKYINFNKNDDPGLSNITYDRQINKFAPSEIPIVVPFRFIRIVKGSYGYKMWEREVHYIDSEGNWVINGKMEKITLIYGGYFSSGLAPVQYEVKGAGSKVGYINLKGELVIKIDNVSNKAIMLAFPFTEGLAGVCINSDSGSKCGFINTKGEWVISPKYAPSNTFRKQFLGGFSEGLAPVCGNCGPDVKIRNEKFGYINKKGEVVIPMQYFMAKAFSGGKAWVARKANSKWKTINTKGEIIK